jgi:hypothetical protein
MSDAEFGDLIKQQFLLSQSWRAYKSILINATFSTDIGTNPTEPESKLSLYYHSVYYIVCIEVGLTIYSKRTK